VVPARYVGKQQEQVLGLIAHIVRLELVSGQPLRIDEGVFDVFGKFAGAAIVVVWLHGAQQHWPSAASGRQGP
jgi:hypothetical protein